MNDHYSVISFFCLAFFLRAAAAAFEAFVAIRFRSCGESFLDRAWPPRRAILTCSCLIAAAISASTMARYYILPANGAKSFIFLLTPC
jgi:hypothetical protein